MRVEKIPPLHLPSIPNLLRRNTKNSFFTRTRTKKIRGDIRYIELPANLRCILPPSIDYSIPGTGTDRYLSNIPNTVTTGIVLMCLNSSYVPHLIAQAVLISHATILHKIHPLFYYMYMSLLCTDGS